MITIWYNNVKVGIYAHCTIDTISYGDRTYELPGGPACYCSLSAKNQKFDINLATKIGPDFPLIEFLESNICLLYTSDAADE